MAGMNAANASTISAGQGSSDQEDDQEQPGAAAPSSEGEAGKDSGIDFDVPTGFEPPEGVKPGDEFEAVASFVIDPDGKEMCITKLEGIPVGEAAEKSKPGLKKGAGKNKQGNNPDFLSSVESGLQGSSSPPEAASSGQTY